MLALPTFASFPLNHFPLHITIAFIMKGTMKVPILFALAVCFAVTAAVFAARAFRGISYVVLVDDSIYEDYVQNAEQPSNGITSNGDTLLYVKKTERNALAERFFGKEMKIAADLDYRTQIALVPQTYEDNQNFYELKREVFYPSVPADFKTPQSPSNSLIAPDLSVTISDLQNIPHGNRALPIEDVYADSPDYKLVTVSGVLCTVYEDAVSEAVNDFCKRLFVADEKKNDIVTVASVGDIMVARGMQEILIENEDGVEIVFDDTLDLLKGADFAIGNLEGVVTESWENAEKTYTFKFKKAVLPKLMDAGFDYLMQTNNHCYDYGERGFKDTLAAFAEYSVPTSGIGYNLDEARKFYHTTIKGLSIAVISCGAYPVEQSGFNGQKTATATKSRAGILWQSDELLHMIREEKDAGNFVIVNVHGGEEYWFAPTKKQRELYESFCDSGADVVFGSHPHVLQPTEWYKNSLIVYSMGNFLFNGMEEMHGGTDSEIVRLGIIDGKIAYVEQYPVSIKNNGVSLKSKSQKG